MKEEILDFIHYGLKTVDLANLNREHLINCFEELEKENADLEEKISVLLSCKNCPENKGGLICQKEYENKCLAQKIEYIKELQEENAELKEEISTKDVLIKELQEQKVYWKESSFDWRHKFFKLDKVKRLIKKDKQLAQAKEIIKRFSAIRKTPYLEGEEELFAQAEQFIEVEK